MVKTIKNRLKKFDLEINPDQISGSENLPDRSISDPQKTGILYSKN